MADIDPLHKEHHVLGNIRGMIRKPLQCARDGQQIESRIDISWILLHEGHQPVIPGLCTRRAPRAMTPPGWWLAVSD
jgi:hypothetical protein